MAQAQLPQAQQLLLLLLRQPPPQHQRAVVKFQLDSEFDGIFAWFVSE